MVYAIIVMLYGLLMIALNTYIKDENKRSTYMNIAIVITVIALVIVFIID